MTDPRSPPWTILSSFPGAAWPAIPSPAPATALALLQQLEHSQWLDAGQIETLQLQQVGQVLKHAWTTVPGYRARWQHHHDPDAPLDMDTFRRLPLLTRADLQRDFASLRSNACPGVHGKPREGRTSGSTGVPVRYLGTAVTELYWNVFTLRDHLWHRRDLSRKLAIVRRESSNRTDPNWGRATAGLVATGPAVGHHLDADAATLLDWLVGERPAYLFAYPSLVREIARLALAGGVTLPDLQEVRTFAEALDDDVRDLCKQAWNVPVTDIYSTSELGYLALQCPEHRHYHVQAEGVLLEVLDADGRPCGPGTVGRVVVTTLHNFAMPLVRYDLGDYAEVGTACPCGRGLPVLTRILGRVRNTLVTADGRRFWPTFGTMALLDLLPIRQHQFVQKTTDLIEAHLVADTPFTADQEAMLRERVLRQMPAGFRLEIVYRDRLARSPSGKFEDFVSEVAAP